MPDTEKKGGKKQPVCLLFSRATPLPQQSGPRVRAELSRVQGRRHENGKTAGAAGRLTIKDQTTEICK